MASKALLMTIIVSAAMASALGMDYMVGDANGWNLKGNYTEWAAGKEFHVGDTLTFMYTQGDHNVLSVTGADFKGCNTSNALKGPYTTGNDKFTLDAPGRKWYICGFGNGTHCSQGMKFVISVTAEAPAPAPNRAPAVSAAGSFMWIAAAATAAFGMIMA